MKSSWTSLAAASALLLALACVNCGGGTTGSLEFPYTNVQSPAPTNPKASDFASYLPNATAISNGAQPISKLP